MTTLVAFSTITLSYDCSIASSGNLLLEYQMGRFICKFKYFCYIKRLYISLWRFNLCFCLRLTMQLVVPQQKTEKKYKKCGNNHFNYFNFKKQNNQYLFIQLLNAGLHFTINNFPAPSPPPMSIEDISDLPIFLNTHTKL